MSGLFGEDEDNAAKRLLRAGATGPTILATLPTDADGGARDPGAEDATEVRSRVPGPACFPL
jgi:hypothetical protein